MTVLTQAVSRWCAADQVPNWPLSANPFATRDWTLAWRNVRTEAVRATRILHVTADGESCVAALHLVGQSPAWSAFEAEAGVPAVWPGPVVYAPTPYATYGGLGSSCPAVIREVIAQGLCWAREAGACAFVAPGLRADQARQWGNAAPSGAAVRTTASHEAPVRGSMAAFQAAIPSHRARKEFGRAWRRGRDAGLRLGVLPGAEMGRVISDFTDLASAAAHRHGTPLYGPDVIRAVASVPGAVLLAAWHRSRLAGGFLCLRHDRVLYLWAAGLDYERLHDLHTYGWLLAEAVRYAAAWGAVTIDAGRGNYTVKRRLGFTQVPLYALCYLAGDDPEIAAALAGMGRRIAAGSPAAEDAAAAPGSLR